MIKSKHTNHCINRFSLRQHGLSALVQNEFDTLRNIIAGIFFTLIKIIDQGVQDSNLLWDKFKQSLKEQQK